MDQPQVDNLDLNVSTFQSKTSKKKNPDLIQSKMSERLKIATASIKALRRRREKRRRGTHHSLFPEVNTDCGDELGVELVVRVAIEEGGLPNTGVPQGEELYKVVVIPISHSDGHKEHLEKTENAEL